MTGRALKLPKYRNTKHNGYASRREAKRAAELEMMQKAGLITDLKKQPRFELVPKQGGERPVHYVADFSYYEYGGNGAFVVEDVKGFKTPMYRLKRKLMIWVHGIFIREI